MPRVLHYSTSYLCGIAYHSQSTSTMFASIRQSECGLKPKKGATSKFCNTDIYHCSAGGGKQLKPVTDFASTLLLIQRKH